MRVVAGCRRRLVAVYCVKGLPIHRALPQWMGNLWLEDFVVADRHAWRCFNRLAGDEFIGVVLEPIDAINHCCAVDCFRGVFGGRGRS